MTSLPLRDYQETTLQAIGKELAEGRNRTAVVLPTGAGKTVVFSHLIQQTLQRERGRAAVLVHREELAEQARAKLHSVAPDLRVGIVKAERNEIDADVLVCSVPTLANVRRLTQVPPLSLVVPDECHHAVAETWTNALKYFGSYDGLPTVGFTATLTRGDSRHLGDVWQSVAYQMDILDLIPNYLVDVKGYRVHVAELDLDAVKRSRGDLQAGDLGRALADADTGEAIARAVRKYAADRQTVVFAPTVDTAYAFAEALQDEGFTAETIEGFTTTEERQAIFERFRTGQTQILTNCMVLTEGWDAPWASCAVIARPTTNAGLYVQMVGRVLRKWPDKDDALVLDVVGASTRNRLASLADLTQSKELEVDEGESLVEAERSSRKTEDGHWVAEPRRDSHGEILHTEIDLFGQSKSVWLKTHQGTFFISTRKWIFFLWPEGNGLWTVGKRPTRGGGTADRVLTGAEQGYAMAWAETLAAEEDRIEGLGTINGGLLTSRSASWRKRQEPSVAQIGMATSIGIPQAELVGRTKAEVSDLISIRKASVLLDDPRKARRNRRAKV